MNTQRQGLGERERTHTRDFTSTARSPLSEVSDLDEDARMEAAEGERILRWQPIAIKTINQEVLCFRNNLSRIVIILKSFAILLRYENGL